MDIYKPVSVTVYESKKRLEIGLFFRYYTILCKK